MAEFQGPSISLPCGGVKQFASFPINQQKNLRRFLTSKAHVEEDAQGASGFRKPALLEAVFVADRKRAPINP